MLFFALSFESTFCSSCVSPRLARSTSSIFFTFSLSLRVWLTVRMNVYVCVCVCDKVNDSIIKQNKQQTNKMLMLHVALGYLETQLHELPSLPLPFPAASSCSPICCFILSLTAAISLSLSN